MVQIKECPRYYISEDGKVWDSKRNRFVPQSQRDKRMGYLCVTLNIDGKIVQRSVHRLVAQAYIPNPNNYPMVNHKDENPQNNHKDNLEWCDAKYNNNYGNRILKMSIKQRNRSDCSRAVLQFGKDGNFIARYPSTAEVERQLKIRNSQISGVCNHRPSYHTAGGYIWKYEDDVTT